MSNTLYELVPITDTKDLKDGWYLLSDGPKINTDWVANPYGQFKGFDWIEVPGTFTHYLRPATQEGETLEYWKDLAQTSISDSVEYKGKVLNALTVKYPELEHELHTCDDWDKRSLELIVDLIQSTPPGTISGDIHAQLSDILGTVNYSSHKQMREAIENAMELLNESPSPASEKEDGKPLLLVERYADNGEHSHYDLIDPKSGETLWSGEQQPVSPEGSGGYTLEQMKECWEASFKWHYANAYGAVPNKHPDLNTYLASLVPSSPGAGKGMEGLIEWLNESGWTKRNGENLWYKEDHGGIFNAHNGRTTAQLVEMYLQQPLNKSK